VIILIERGLKSLSARQIQLRRDKGGQILMGNTEDLIRQILADVTNCPADAPANADLYLELGVVSVQAIMLLAELEEKFGMHIPDDRFIEARCISQLIGLMDGLSDHPSLAPHV
jgi:acyl carrier protein